MNKFKKLFVATLAGLVVAGCASTTAEGPAKYPELKVLSNTPYVWDNSISDALNVARMAQPAGPGVGMKDFDDGKKAVTGKITGGERLFDAGLGLIAMGGFGVLSMESLNDGVNRQLDWKPTLVTFIPKTSAQPDYKTIRDALGEKIKDALKKEYPSLVWHGGYAHAKSFSNGNTEYLLFDAEGCKQYFKYESKDKNEQKNEYFSDNRRRNFVEGDPGLTKYCVYGGMLEVSGKTVKDGSEFWIVSYEPVNGFFFNGAMEKYFDGYVLAPELYDFRANDVSLNIVVNYGYARVYKQGKELLFQKQ
jgi:hypothetical protein